MRYGEQSLATPIKRRSQSPTGLQNPSAWARPIPIAIGRARVRSCECQPSINSTNVVWNTFVKEFSEGRQSGERINLGASFASFGQAKEDKSYMPVGRQFGFIFEQFYRCHAFRFV